MATIIASQSIITGAFSMTRQAIQLGWLPRLRIVQTSADGYGQIYVGAVNWLLMLVTIALTVWFGKSDNLAAAYGIAVSLTMLMTSALLLIAMREIWEWSLPVSIAVAGVFCVDTAFFLSEQPQDRGRRLRAAALAAAVYASCTSGIAAPRRSARASTESLVPVDTFMAQLEATTWPACPAPRCFSPAPPRHAAGACLARPPQSRPARPCGRDHSEPVPWIRRLRAAVTLEAPEFWRAVVRYGFMERPDIPRLLASSGNMAAPSISPMSPTTSATKP